MKDKEKYKFLNFKNVTEINLYWVNILTLSRTDEKFWTINNIQLHWKQKQESGLFYMLNSFANWCLNGINNCFLKDHWKTIFC